MKVVTRTAIAALALTATSAVAQEKAVGGPYEPVVQAGAGTADPNYKALFSSWKSLEQAQTGFVAIPSAAPTD